MCLGSITVTRDHTLTNRLERWTPGIINNSSVVLRVAYGEVSFLLTGDIEHYAESAMLASGINLASMVYKVPHHGSDTSSAQEFLDAVAPTVAVISVAVENRFRYPDEEVVARLRHGVVLDNNVLLTSDRGDIRFTTDGEKLWMDTER